MIQGCNECGICKTVCPMYKIMLKESQSPRGILRLENKNVKTTLIFNCTNCLACKEICPSKIDFNIELARQKIIKETEIESTKQILENIKKHNNPYGIDETEFNTDKNTQ